MTGTQIVLSLALAMSLRPAQAQTQAQAATFVQSLYRRYTPRGDGPEVTGKLAPRIFTPAVVALIRKDEREAQGEVGRLDGDPICDCQDATGLTLTALHVSLTGAQTATAVATIHQPFPGAEATRKLKLQLVWTAGGWRVDDVISPDGTSLRRILTAKL